MAKALFPDEPELEPLDDLPGHKVDWGAAATLGTAEITPFTAKALYIFGVMRHSIETAGLLLEHRKTVNGRGAFYVSAYLSLAAAVELLGRCTLGDPKVGPPSGKRLRHGFREIAGLSDADAKSVVITLDGTAYTIEQCETFRNFAAHGSGAAKAGVSFTADLICVTTGLLAQGIQHYWDRLTDPKAHDARTSLAKAAVAPLFYHSGTGSRPLHVNEMLEHVKNGRPIGSSLQHDSAWRSEDAHPT